MMRYFFLLCVFAVLCVGCQAPPQKTARPLKQLRINIGDEPLSLDPRSARELNCVTVVRMLCEGLTRINPHDRAELALAKSISFSPDLKKVTVMLIESQWSNGDPVTADDFVYAWKKVLDPQYPSDTAFQLYAIKNGKEAKEGKVSLDQVGIRAIDRQTFEIELEYAVPYFLELVAFPAFFPVNSRVDQANPHWAENAETYVGNGPFQLAEWKHSNQIVVRKNERYWDAAQVQVDSIELSMVKEEIELKMFEMQELDWAGSPLSKLPIDALKALKEGHSLKTQESLATYFIRTNTGVAPFNHPLMRKAFALAINRSDLVEHVIQGDQKPALSFIPPSLNVQQSPYFEDHAIEKAKQLFKQALAELHLKPSQLPEIVLSYCTDERHALAQALQQQWFDAFGIRVRLEKTETKIYFDRVSKKNYQLALGSWVADYKDPINFLEVFKYKNSGSNNTQWENPQYVALLDRSSTCVDHVERMRLFQESEAILMDEMPIIPLFYFTMLYLNQPNIKDVVVSSMGTLDFKWASVDSSEQGEIR